MPSLIVCSEVVNGHSIETSTVDPIWTTVAGVIPAGSTTMNDEVERIDTNSGVTATPPISTVTASAVGSASQGVSRVPVSEAFPVWTDAPPVGESVRIGPVTCEPAGVVIASALAPMSSANVPTRMERNERVMRDLHLSSPSVPDVRR